MPTQVAAISVSLSILLTLIIHPALVILWDASPLIWAHPSRFQWLFLTNNLSCLILWTYVKISQEFRKLKTSSIWLQYKMYPWLSSPQPSNSNSRPQFEAWLLKAPTSPARMIAICRLLCGSYQVTTSRTQAADELGLQQYPSQEGRPKGQQAWCLTLDQAGTSPNCLCEWHIQKADWAGTRAMSRSVLPHRLSPYTTVPPQ